MIGFELRHQRLHLFQRHRVDSLELGGVDQHRLELSVARLVQDVFLTPETGRRVKNEVDDGFVQGGGHLEPEGLRGALASGGAHAFDVFIGDFPEDVGAGLSRRLSGDRVASEDAFGAEVEFALRQGDDEVLRVEVAFYFRVDEDVRERRGGITHVGYLGEQADDLSDQPVDHRRIGLGVGRIDRGLVALVVDDEHGALAFCLCRGRFDPCLQVAQDGLVLFDDPDGLLAGHDCFACGGADLSEVTGHDFKAAWFADGARKPGPARVVDRDEILLDAVLRLVTKGVSYAAQNDDHLVAGVGCLRHHADEITRLAALDAADGQTFVDELRHPGRCHHAHDGGGGAVQLVDELLGPSLAFQSLLVAIPEGAAAPRAGVPAVEGFANGHRRAVFREAFDLIFDALHHRIGELLHFGFAFIVLCQVLLEESARPLQVADHVLVLAGQFEEDVQGEVV